MVTKVKKTINISPVTRIEGHLEFSVDVEDGKAVDARSTGAEFRGFELMLNGRDPMDALVFVQRICGVCPTSHMTCAVEAIENAFGAEVPPNAHLVRSLMLGLENAYSHVAHFYALFGPDLVNKKYSGHPAYKELEKRFTALSGTSYVKAVLAKRALNEAYAILGGQFPHSNAFVPGGVTCTPDVSDIVKIIGIWMGVKSTVEEMVLGCSAERWLENKSLADVQKWLGESPAHENSDLGVFIKIGPDLELPAIGAGPPRLLAYAAYRQADGSHWLKSGFYDEGKFDTLEQTKITEHVKHSWFADYDGGKHPGEGETSPHYETGVKYSFLKSPRYDGKVAQVGPLARQVTNQDPLVLDLAKELGINVFTRMLARLHEAVKLLVQIRVWLDEIDLAQPFYTKPEWWPKVPTRRAEGIGLTEAGRGALGHWVSYEDGRIKDYQIITPTAWNASPRDSEDNPGAIEQAVIGTPVADETNPVEIYHVIRSFDPCLSCATHIISGNKRFTFRVV